MAPWHLVSTGQNRSSHAARFDLKVSPCITTAVEQQQQMRTSWINCYRDWISWLRLCLTCTKRLSISQPFSAPLNDRLSNLKLSAVLKRFSALLSCSSNSANKFPEKFFQTFINLLSRFREAALISIRLLLSILPLKTTITSTKIWNWYNPTTPGRIRNPFPIFGPTQQMGLGRPLGPRLVKPMASEDVSLQAWRALTSLERSWEMVILWIVIADRFRLQVRRAFIHNFWHWFECVLIFWFTLLHLCFDA